MKTPEQIAAQVAFLLTPGYAAAFDGFTRKDAEQIALAAIEADRAQWEATLSYFVIATQGSRSVETIVGRYSSKLEADAVADAWKDVNGQYGIHYRVEEDYA